MMRVEEKTIKDYNTCLVTFTDDDIKQVQDNIKNMHLNQGGANGCDRSVATVKKKHAYGILS